MIKNKNKTGFTLPELIISIAIIGLITGVISLFQKDIFTLNFTAQNNLSAQLEARHVLKQFVAEMRESSPSSLGSYPIAFASTSAITFYTDTNSDGLKERIRYYLSGKNLMRAVVTPTGNPLLYVDANEKVSISVSNIVNASNTPILQYFDTNYSGTSTPLTHPLNITQVRLIKVNLLIDKDPNKSPQPISVTTQVSIRNLKDNL